MSGGTLSSDFEMLKAHLLDILRAHEGMRVFSPREDGSTRRGPWIRELEKGILLLLFFESFGSDGGFHQIGDALLRVQRETTHLEKHPHPVGALSGFGRELGGKDGDPERLTAGRIEADPVLGARLGFVWVLAGPRMFHLGLDRLAKQIPGSASLKV